MAGFKGLLMTFCTMHHVKTVAGRLSAVPERVAAVFCSSELSVLCDFILDRQNLT